MLTASLEGPFGGLSFNAHHNRNRHMITLDILEFMAVIVLSAAIGGLITLGLLKKRIK